MNNVYELVGLYLPLRDIYNLHINKISNMVFDEPFWKVKFIQEFEPFIGYFITNKLNDWRKNYRDMIRVHETAKLYIDRINRYYILDDDEEEDGCELEFIYINNVGITRNVICDNKVMINKLSTATNYVFMYQDQTSIMSKDKLCQFLTRCLLNNIIIYTTYCVYDY